MARAINTSIFVKNAPTYAGLGLGERASPLHDRQPDGRGLTTAGDFAVDVVVFSKNTFVLSNYIDLLQIS